MNTMQLGTTVRKIIELLDEKSLIKDTYFNPMFSTDLANKIPELEQSGFKISQTETESEEGTTISASIIGPNNEELNLGTVLLDGENIIVKNSLVVPNDLISFIESNSLDQF
jgi:hypothetical protein